ncbi:hypothetical protein Tco_0804441 [Tanacetum coccineum]|uniref:Uncharacterized protein n=1 Tax=Tanacetum coccineum TaxID=301880 RepID=A0ABQ5A8U5_9ASTR
MSDSKHSTVTYTSVSFLVEDDSDIGSPGVDGPPIMPEDPYAYIMAAYEVPPSPDYILGPEVPPSPDYISGPEGPPSPDYPLHAATSPTAESPGYIPESDPEEDPEEDPADYPADRDDEEDEEEEEEHPALADFVSPVHRMTARISIRDEPSISLPPREEVERLLALTTPPPSPLTPLSSPLPQIPSPPLPIPSPPPNSPTHIKIIESCLPLRKRVRFASPTLSCEVGESSAAGAARQDRPTIARDDPYSIAREDLYGFVDMVDVPPRCSTSRELDYDITDTCDDLVGAIDEIAPTTIEGVNQRVTDLATIVEEETTSMYGIMEVNDRPRRYCCTWSTVMQPWNDDDRHTSGTGVRRPVQVARECTYPDFLKCQPLNFKGTEGVPCKGNYSYMVELPFKTTTPEAAHAMPWRTLKKIMTDKYCPRGKIKKLEFEMWNLKVNGNDVTRSMAVFDETKAINYADAIEFATDTHGKRSTRWD